MTIEQLLAEVEHLDEWTLEQLKARIARRESELNAPRPRTAEEWGEALNQFLDDFWGDTPEEEQKEIIEAIRFKTISSDQCKVN